MALTTVPFVKKALLGLGIASLAACMSTPEAPLSTHPLLVGSYTAGQSQGIYRFVFDSQSGQVKAEPVQVVKAGNPSWLTLSKDQHRLFVVNENGPGQADVAGHASSYSIDPKSHELSLIDQVDTQGDEPTYASLSSDERYMFAANYAVHPDPGGSLAVLPIGADGKLGPVSQQERHAASNVDKERQASSHVHSVVSSPDGKYLFVQDLGADRLFVYRYDPSNAQKPLTPSEPAEVVLPPGSGPRHLVFSADGQHAYLTLEMAEEVVAFDYQNGQLHPRQMISLRSAKGPAGGGGGVHLSADGHFLYVANRGSLNELVVFQVNPADGTLKEVQRRSAEGKEPREFSIDPSGNFMLIANQKSNEIIVLRRDPQTGLLGDVVQRLASDSPSDLKFLK